MNSDNKIIARAHIFFKRLHTENMKAIKLKLLCAAALAMCLPLSACTNGEAGATNVKQGTEFTQSQKDDKCPDGSCPDRDNDRCPECPDNSHNKGDECPDGKCPKRKMPGGRRRGKLLPCPDRGGNK